MLVITGHNDRSQRNKSVRYQPQNRGQPKKRDTPEERRDQEVSDKFDNIKRKQKFEFRDSETNWNYVFVK